MNRWTRSPLLPLWLAVAALALGQLALYRRFLSQPERSRPPSSGGPPRAEELLEARLLFPEELRQALAEQRLGWLEDALRRLGVDDEQAERVRGALARYMEMMNEVRVMELRGVHSPAENQRFYALQEERLDRALRMILGEQRAAALEAEGRRNGLYPREARGDDDAP